MSLAVIILAAGKGTRMNSHLPKVLHQITGDPMILFSLKIAEDLRANKVVTVIRKNAHNVESAVNTYSNRVKCVEQQEQKGTGHAVNCAEKYLNEFTGNVLILYGDAPFITPEIIKSMLETKTRKEQIVVLGFETSQPNNYGRIQLDNSGNVSKIIEVKDATTEELKITFCNSGIIVADKTVLFSLINQLSNNNLAKEYYLTDIIEIANNQGYNVIAAKCEKEFASGVNTQEELAEAENYLQKKLRSAAMINGVKLVAPETVFFSSDTKISAGTVVQPYVVFGKNVKITGPTVIKSFSHLEGCTIAEGASIGPFTRIRPGTKIGEAAKIGNFVEVKESSLAQGVKAGHLTYIGNARIDENVNIGAGTVFCNYDGVSKHHTEIHSKAFIGSNTSLIAPVKVGKGALVAASSVITKDVPNASLAISRSTQINKKGFAKIVMDKLRKLQKRIL